MVIYARVSNNGQKDDLFNQVEFLRQFANARGIIVNEVLEDIGSGLNYNRKKWNMVFALVDAYNHGLSQGSRIQAGDILHKTYNFVERN